MTDGPARVQDRHSARFVSADLPSEVERWIRERHERTRPDDTFDDLRRRAAFDRQDAGLLRDWIRAAREAIRDMPPEEE